MQKLTCEKDFFPFWTELLCEYLCPSPLHHHQLRMPWMMFVTSSQGRSALRRLLKSSLRVSCNRVMMLIFRDTTYGKQIVLCTREQVEIEIYPAVSLLNCVPAPRGQLLICTKISCGVTMTLGVMEILNQSDSSEIPKGGYGSRLVTAHG